MSLIARPSRSVSARIAFNLSSASERDNSEGGILIVPEITLLRISRRNLQAMAEGDIPTILEIAAAEIGFPSSSSRWIASINRAWLTFIVNALWP
jgi:hypothetical protein